MIGADRLQPKQTAAMAVLAGLLEARTGQRIAANRTWRIETALKPLLRERGFESLDHLVTELVKSQNGAISDAIIDALLNQETSFYRDTGVLEAVAVAADAMTVAEPGRRTRIWSAACSSGQEPLSLAMIFAERALRDGGAEPEILATDVSESAIARARAGRYSQFEIQRGLPVRRMITWFEPDGSEWVAKPELVRRVTYRRHNLVGEAPPSGAFDIILCRNILLYLSPTLRQQVFELLARAIRADGLLVLGAGETVIGQSELFVPSARAKGFYEPALTAAARLRATG